MLLFLAWLRLGKSSVWTLLGNVCLIAFAAEATTRLLKLNFDKRVVRRQMLSVA